MKDRNPRRGTSVELGLMRRLRVVFKRSSSGLGLSSSFVSVFSSSDARPERDAVRRILLGIPVHAALAGLVDSHTSSGDLLRFVGSLAQISAREASKGAERISFMLDRWTMIKERREMERRVMAFRGLVVSLVSGVVVGMLATLAPALAGFSIALSAAPRGASGFSPYEGVLFLIPSATCLGFYLSPGRPYLNLAASLVAFLSVVYLLGPLMSFSLAA
jgi:hypothetical protein